MKKGHQNIVVLAGATGSGKSRLAQWIAESTGGVIINADSQQMYRELRILTARPTPQEEARLPHRLYGSLPADEGCSAGRWLKLAGEAIDSAHEEGKLPIVVGGTGLYLRTLMEGISFIPDIQPHVRRRSLALYKQLGGEGFHAMLAERDPQMASRLRPGDRQRMMRAWDVMEQTGRSLAEWHREGKAPRYRRECFFSLRLDLPREELYARCDQRFALMMEQGALKEVEALLALNLAASLPLMRAVGVRELGAYLGGGMTLEEAIAKSQQATRNYAKRQLTWFRHQMKEAQGVDGTENPQLLADIRAFSALRE
jgi:tRNA dimethylallyltransferase